MIVIQAVNVRGRLALTADGVECEITNLLDIDGDETDDADAAESAVAALPDGRWAWIKLSEFEPATVN